jgi:hypothetical protein
MCDVVHDSLMATLHIEYATTDMDAWLSGFNRVAAGRRNLGVRSEVVQRSVDDENCIVVDFEFDTIDLASAFLRYLTEMAWANEDNELALAGTPRTLILERVQATSHGPSAQAGG